MELISCPMSACLDNTTFAFNNETQTAKAPDEVFRWNSFLIKPFSDSGSIWSGEYFHNISY